MNSDTFYWHDYETFGANPALDRPSQFAGIRTDADFNVIGEPLVIYCRPAADILPQPQACLITGITPQLTLEKGLTEREFIARIHDEMAQPNTCSVGYNSIRFDDEVTRYTLFRNFYDPYEREWKNGNSRWDLIDVVRMCRALRPDGINWPDHDDGTPSFKLEHLTVANGISHDAAHDALSDVYATIALAKLIKEKQPKLFAYMLGLRRKQEVAMLLDLKKQTPLLHSSAMFPAARFCTSLIMPLAPHPSNKNSVICYDLSVDPTPLLQMGAEAVKARLYTPTADLPEGESRIALKTVQINRCPVLATSKLLNDEIAARIQLDLPAARAHYQQLKSASDLSGKLAEVFASDHAEQPKRDPELSLYQGGFFSAADKAQMAAVRRSSPESLAEPQFQFDDERLAVLLFRYRARNFPESLSPEEQLQWQEFCYQRLTEEEYCEGLTLEAYLEEVEGLLAAESLSDAHRDILEALLHYGDELLA